MHGQRPTAFETFHARSNRDEPEKQVWLADWKSYGLPYGSIYIVAPDNDWPCKIGISANPRKRLLQLQTSVWRPIQVARCYWAETMREAKRLEAAVHRRLTEDSRWLHGEWFDMRPDEAAEMLEFISMVENVDICDHIEHEEVLADVCSYVRFSNNPKLSCDLLERRVNFSD